MRPDRPRYWRGWPAIDDGAGTETDRSAAHPDRLAAMPVPGALSLPAKIPKTTPCKVARRSPACVIPRKHFDTSGKSPAIFHDSAICKTPMDTGDNRFAVLPALPPSKSIRSLHVRRFEQRGMPAWPTPSTTTCTFTTPRGADSLPGVMQLVGCISET